MHRHPTSSRSPGLLGLPGWDDHGKQQFDVLSMELASAGWVCRRANTPDASWPSVERVKVSSDQAFQQALEDYMDLAAVRGVARSRLALLGFSYGGYMATFLSAAKPSRCLVLRSPAIYPDNGWREPKESLDKLELRDYRSRLLSPQDNRSLWCCAQFRGDVLLVDSAEDAIIPQQVIASYERAFSRVRSMTRYTLADADHELSQPAWQREYHNVVVDWLKTCLP